MPNINLRDARNRDAVVRAEPVSQTATVRYTDQNGGSVQMRKVLKGTLATSYETLLAQHEGDADTLGAALVAGDPEIDMERTGMFLAHASRVWLNADNRIVYRIVQTEIVRGADGQEKERRPLKRSPINIDGEIPLTWTGRKIKKNDALGRFVFHQKLQIVHVNGLTYDFLYGVAKELADADSLMLLGAGQSGKDPLILRHGATPCRGFLEGRIDGDKYVLLLHLSNMELKRPAPVAVAAEAAIAAQPAAQVPTVDAPNPVPVPVPEPVQRPIEPPVPIAAEAVLHKPTVRDVLAATAHVATPLEGSAKAAIQETVADAKASKQRARAPKRGTSETAAPADAAPAKAADAKPARKTRAPRSKPAGETPAA